MSAETDSYPNTHGAGRQPYVNIPGKGLMPGAPPSPRETPEADRQRAIEDEARRQREAAAGQAEPPPVPLGIQPSTEDTQPPAAGTQPEPGDGNSSTSEPDSDVDSDDELEPTEEDEQAVKAVLDKNPKDYCGLLGLQAQESGYQDADVLKAFVQAARLVHPDHNQAEESKKAYKRKLSPISQRTC